MGKLCKIFWQFCNFSADCWFFFKNEIYGQWGYFSYKFDLEDGSLWRRKKAEKIFRFSKNWFLWDKTYISRLPTLSRIQKYTFYPSFMNWPDRRVQNVPVIDDNFATVKYGIFLRNIVTLFFVVFFIIFTSLCLPLFVYISCHGYYYLITFFSR